MPRARSPAERERGSPDRDREQLHAFPSHGDLRGGCRDLEEPVNVDVSVSEARGGIPVERGNFSLGNDVLADYDIPEDVEVIDLADEERCDGRDDCGEKDETAEIASDPPIV